MELLNIIGFLFLVFHSVMSGKLSNSDDFTTDLFTTPADIFPGVREAAIQGTIMCASKCFADIFSDITYFTYTAAESKCTCNDQFGKILATEMSRLDYESPSKAVITCADMCYDRNPTTVGYVAYDRQHERCFCRDESDEIILNAYLNDLENAKMCYAECSNGAIKPKEFHYNKREKACDCYNQ